MPRARTAREERLLRTVRDIVERVPRRTAGSPDERGAAEYLGERFRRLGLQVALQPVALAPHQHLPLIAGLALVVLGAILLAWSAPLAAMLAVVGVIVIVSEGNATPTISRFLPKRQSHNVLAKLPCRSAPERTLVVVAHLDAARPTLFTHPRAVAIRRQSFVFATNAAGIVALLAVLGSFSSLTQIWWAAFAAGLYLLLYLAVLVHGSLNLSPSPGANDDASGLAVLVELPERLRALEGTEVWLLAVSGHETGLAGMRQALRLGVPRDALVINLESVGAGSINLTLLEGYLRRTPVSRQLLQVGAHVVHDEQLAVRARAYRTEPTEANLCMRSGIAAISVVGVDRRGLPPNWHWRTDTLANLDPSKIDVAARLVEGIALRLDGPPPPLAT